MATRRVPKTEKILLHINNIYPDICTHAANGQKDLSVYAPGGREKGKRFALSLNFP